MTASARRGPVGPAGPVGPIGVQGPSGSNWLDGNGAPGGGLGVNGDYYLQHGVGDVWKKTAGAWSVVTNIRGGAGGSRAVQLAAFSGFETLIGFAGIHNALGQPAWDDLVPFGRYSNVAGESISWPVWLNAGTYTVDVINFLSSHYGLGAFEVDGAQQFTIDQSAIADAKTTYRKVGSFSVATSGMHTLTYRCLALAGAVATDNVFIDVFSFVLRGGRPGMQIFPNTDAPIKVSGSWGSGPGRTLWTPQNNLTSQFVDGAGGAHQTFEVPYLPFSDHPGAAGIWLESEMFLDAGTYAFDVHTVLGTAQGVGQLKVDGVAVGQPQPAGTVRGLGAPANPGNGNKAGAALAVGEVDHYDTTVGALWPSAGDTGSLLIQGVIANALTGIVIPTSDWHTVRYTCVGKNQASANYSLGAAGWLRRTA